MVLPYDDAGRGPAVVLLHAGICDRTMWREHIPALASAGYRVIAPELPGFGEARPPEGHDRAPWDDVLETLAAAGVSRSVLVGNSFGAAVALRAADAAPSAVAGLVLVAASAPDLEPGPELIAAWEAEESALERGDIEGAVAAVLDAWLPADAPAELRDRVGAMQRRTFELQQSGEIGEIADPLEEDPGRLARIDVPALVAVGELDKPDFLIGADRLATALPNVEQVRLPGVGHLVPLEVPQAFLELVLAFLARIEVS